MAIAVQCPHCEKLFHVREEFAGRKGRCPGCGGVVTAPELSETAVQPAPVRPPVVERPANATASSTEPGTPAAMPGFSLETGADSSVATRVAGKSRHVGRKKPLWPVILLAAALPVIASLVLVVIVMSRDDGTATSGEVAVASAAPVADGAETSDPTTLANTDFSAPVKAHSIDEITEAMVKVFTPIPGGLSTGAGFIIDRRGWIATNYHVIDDANDAIRVVTEKGTWYDVAGLIAADPHRDIAILKLASQPYQITVADISYNGEPHRLDSVYAYGHPEHNDFSVTSGIVSRVVDTDHLPQESRYFLAVEMGAPSDHIWIQNDAATTHGNSGGPLINEDFQIIGINTWGDPSAQMSFASHIRYVREMAASASGEIEPIP